MRISLASAALGLWLAIATTASAEQPTMWYSGTLVDSCNQEVDDGLYRIAVTLWSSSESDDATVHLACGQLYADKYGGLKGAETLAPDVAVAVGRFRLPLSADCVAALSAHPKLWIQIEADGTTFLPRTELGAAPAVANGRLTMREVTASDLVQVNDKHVYSALPNTHYLLTAETTLATFQMPTTGTSFGDRLRITSTSNVGWHLEHGAGLEILGADFRSYVPDGSAAGTLSAVRGLEPGAGLELLRISSDGVTPVVWKVTSQTGTLFVDNQTIFAFDPDHSASLGDVLKRFEATELPSGSYTFQTQLAPTNGDFPNHTRLLNLKNTGTASGVVAAKLTPRLPSALSPTGFDVSFQAVAYYVPNDHRVVHVQFVWGTAGDRYAFGIYNEVGNPERPVAALKRTAGGTTTQLWESPIFGTAVPFGFRLQALGNEVRFRYWSMHDSSEDAANWITMTLPSTLPENSTAYIRMHSQYGGTQAWLGSVVIRRLTEWSEQLASEFYPPEQEIYEAP